MTIATISNGETGLSARNKINDLISRSQSVVDVVADWGADPTGGTPSDAALGNAISDCFGTAKFTGGTGGTLSTTLTVTSVEQGFLQVGRQIRIGAQHMALFAGATMIATGVGGSIQPNALVTVTGTATVSSQNSGPNGGAGNYTISASQTYLNSITSGSYNSSGLVTLVLPSSIPLFTAGQQIAVNLSGTGSISSLNGIFTATNVNGATIQYNCGHASLTVSITGGAINVPVLTYSEPLTNQSANIVSGPTNGGAGTYMLSGSGLAIFAGSANLFCSNTVGGVLAQSVEQRKLVLPSGNYNITKPLYIVGALDACIEGLGYTNITCNFLGSEGNVLSGELPALTPALMIDGVDGGIIENIGFVSGGRSGITMATNATATVGSNQIQFANSATGIGNDQSVIPNASSIPTVGWLVYSISDTMSIEGALITSVNVGVNNTTYTLAGNVTAGHAVSSGDIFTFVNSTVGTYLYKTGFWDTTSSLIFRNCSWYNFGQGIYGGANVAGNCENMEFDHCTAQLCSLAGYRVVGLNTLNWQATGGGVTNCGTASNYDPYRGATGTNNNAGGFSIVNGSFRLIDNQSCDFNVWDVNQGTESPVTVRGGRSEGGGVYPTIAQFNCTVSSNVLTVSGSPAYGIIYPGGQLDIGGYILSKTGASTYTTSAPDQVGTITVNQVGRRTDQCFFAQGAMMVDGHEVGGDFGGMVGGSLAGEGMRYVDCPTGIIMLRGILMGLSGNPASDVLVFANLGNSGTLISDGLIVTEGAGADIPNLQILGGGTANVTMRGSFFLVNPTNLFTNFTGKVKQFDNVFPARTYANLFSPSAIFDGCVMIIDDSNTVWSFGNIGTQITSGGGSNTVPLRRSSTHWVISG